MNNSQEAMLREIWSHVVQEKSALKKISKFIGKHRPDQCSQIEIDMVACIEAEVSPDSYEAMIISELKSLYDSAGSQLVSAAPELLEALTLVVGVADRNTVEFDKARAAISKATS